MWKRLKLFIFWFFRRKKAREIIHDHTALQINVLKDKYIKGHYGRSKRHNNRRTGSRRMQAIVIGKNIQITLMAYTSLLDAIDKKLKNTSEPFDLVLFGFFFMKTESELKELRQEVQKLIEAAYFNLGK